jgi:DNA polymerase III alpha subunit
MTPDSAIDIEDYAKRCVEIGSKVLSSVEHGWQGQYYNTYDVAKKYDLKFIFGTEAYWVKDRKEKDSTNAHIIILAKNETGRRAINNILSVANEEGYYYKPRIDLELLFSLPPKDVFVTSACIGFWKYDDAFNTFLKLHEYFKENFMAEVQYHDVESQKYLNQIILKLSEENNIRMIMGCDSHYIYQNQKEEREYYLLSKGIIYEDENNWYMDFPSIEEAHNRFLHQGIFNKNQIKEIINNTNITLEFDDISFSNEPKLPTIFPDKTQEEKDLIFKQIINEEWNKIKNTIQKDRIKEYLEAIRFEVNTITNTKMTDYFLLDYYLVKRAKEKGGIITQSGRGSGVCYFINKLLGFTHVDRISAKIQMYPERFISETRIIESKQMPDLDLNLGNPEVFAEIQEELLGKGHSYPMVALGTLKKKSAFKMYARANNIDPQLANNVSEQIEKYEIALKHVEEDEKDTVDIFEFVDEEYHELIKESKKYEGIISDKKQHACGYLIYDGDIKSEIGLIRCKSESTGKDIITTVIDGATADKYGFLKNDLLKVNVVKINNQIYKKIGIEPLSVEELLNITDNDQKTWNIYHNGLTMCINQVEQDGTTRRVMKYKPTNIVELSYFIAAIRPGFKSMYNIFESKKPFSYDIKALDKLIQTKEMPYSFIIFQEQVMKVLNYAGIPIDESYNLIKAISKKKKEVILQAKEKVIQGFYDRVKEEEPELKDEEIEKKSKQVWLIIESCISYLFNSPHAYCVSLDSLMGAYLKANYTYEFYETVLQIYSEKKNKDKINLIKKEMQKGFGIKIGDIKFGLDNRGFIAYKNEGYITEDLSSVKFLNTKIAEELFALKDNKYEYLIDLLYDITNKTSCNSRQINILIYINYFSNIYKNNKILKIYNSFQKLYDRKQIKKNKVQELNIEESLIKKYSRETEKSYLDLDVISILKEYEDSLENDSISIIDQIIYESEYAGNIRTLIPQINNGAGIITSVNTKYTPVITVYYLKTGEENKYKIPKKIFRTKILDVNDPVMITKTEQRPRYRKVDGGFEKIEGEYEPYIIDYYKVSAEKLNDYIKTLNAS